MISTVKFEELSPEYLLGSEFFVQENDEILAKL